MENFSKNSPGFTLIEAVSYLGLLSLILVLILPAFFNFFIAAEREMSSLSESEDTSFASRKIIGLISSAAEIGWPPASESDVKLKVRPLNEPQERVIIGLLGEAVFVKRENGSGEMKFLNSGRAKISDLMFVHNPEDEFSRASVSFSFSINSRQISTTTVEIARISAN